MTEKTTDLCMGEYEYRFFLSESGKKLTCEQWDAGNQLVDGTKRKPQWVEVWCRRL